MAISSDDSLAWSKTKIDDNRDLGSAKMRYRLKLGLTSSIRRLRNRGKNGFEDLDKTNRSVLLDFSNSVPIMSEKQHFVLENSILLPGFAFFQPGLSRFGPGSRWIFWTMWSFQRKKHLVLFHSQKYHLMTTRILNP